MSHSPLAPSSAHKWVPCSGSYWLQVDNPERVYPKFYSTTDEGTQAHNWAEMYIAGEVQAFEIPSDIWEYIEDYCEHCVELSRKSGGGYVEFKVPLFYLKGDTGTTDYMTWHEDTLYIRDYKHGYVEVEAKNNLQFIIYGIGSILHIKENHPEDFKKIKKVSLGVFQPRLWHADKNKFWEVSVNELLEDWVSVIQEGADKIKRAQVEFNIGEWCRFCPCNCLCNHYWKYVMSDIPSELLDLELDELDDWKLIETMSPEIQAELIRKQKIVEKFYESLHHQVTNDMLAGGQNPDLVLARGKSPDSYLVDKEEAEKVARKVLPKKDLYKEPQMKSATQIKSLLKAREAEPKVLEQFEDLIARPKGDFKVFHKDTGKKHGWINPSEEFDDLSDD